MRFEVRDESRRAGGRSDTVWILGDEAGARAEVWPGHGFNCLRWRAEGSGELLYVRPDWDDDPVPTRSGIPVLFPFPNRIRDGKYRFDGREYVLPLNDPAKANAAHGFSPRCEWRVIDSSCDADGARITGEFRISHEAPDKLPLWPGDCSLTLTYRLERSRLRLCAEVENHADSSVPFGLGYHPYFRFSADEDCSEWRVFAPVTSEWELEDNLPTGRLIEPGSPLNVGAGLAIGEREFDHLYTGLPAGANPRGGRMVASLSHPSEGRIEVWGDGDFRELIVFTAPHRKAVALEPYTCATDAVNLAERGVDAGWRTLGPGEKWAGEVEFRWVSGS